MSKTLLVIGAGLAQVDAIKRVKDLGYKILATDGAADALCFKVADQ